MLARTTLPGLHLALLKALLKAEAQEQEESEDDGFDEDEDDVGRVQLDQLPKLTASTCQQVLELYLAMAGYVPDPAFKVRHIFLTMKAADEGFGQIFWNFSCLLIAALCPV